MSKLGHYGTVEFVETEFGTLCVDEPDRLANARMTRDAFMYGSFENAVVQGMEKIMERCRYKEVPE